MLNERRKPMIKLPSPLVQFVKTIQNQNANFWENRDANP